MSNETKQKQKERKVFKKFASICPIGICLDSIRQPDPPKPDIFCKDKNGNIIEFELGEAIDQNIPRSMDLYWKQTKIGMRDYFESLRGVEKEKFSKLYCDAIFHFSFREGATKKQRQNAYPTIFSFLLSLSPGYKGDVATSAQGFPKICKSIAIHRVVNGPQFNELPGSHVTFRVFEMIKSKFENSFENPYDTIGQLELLIHNFHMTLERKDYWILEVQDYLQKYLNDSQFKRVWVFDFNKSSIEYVYP